MPQERVEEFPAADAAYDVAMRRLDDQMRQIDAIDNKIALVIGTASAIAALFAGFAATTVEAAETGSLVTGILALASVGLIYGWAAYSAFRAYWFYEWSLRPNWDQLIEFSSTSADGLVKSWIAANCVRSMKENVGQIENKVERAGLAFKLLMAQGLATVAGMLAIVLVNGVTS
jgi:hypothetical protein